MRASAIGTTSPRQPAEHEAVGARRPRGVAKQIPKIARTVPWLIVTGLVLTVSVLVRQRAASTFTAIDGMAMLQIGLVGAGALTLLICGVHNVWTSGFGRINKFLMLYYGVCLLSAAWSLVPVYTIFRAGQMICLLFLVNMGMANAESRETAENSFLVLTLLYTICVVVMHLRLGNLAINVRTMHTNQYSATALIGCLYCLAEGFIAKGTRRRSMFRWSCGFLFFIVIGTSSSSNVSLLLGVLVLMLIPNTPKWPLLVMVLLAIPFAFVAEHYQGELMAIIFPGKNEERILSGGGRMYLWQGYFRAIQDSPWLGHGFAAVTRLGNQFGSPQTTNAHNGWLDVLLGSGALGVLLFTGWLLAFTREVLRSIARRAVGSAGVATAFIGAMANNLSRSLVGGSFDPPHTVFLIFAAFASWHVFVENSEHRAYMLKRLALLRRGASRQELEMPRGSKRTNSLQSGTP